jgi:hypothetical protein
LLDYEMCVTIRAFLFVSLCLTGIMMSFLQKRCPSHLSKGCGLTDAEMREVARRQSRRKPLGCKG